MTHTSNDVHASNIDSLRRQLELQLQERLDILGELPPVLPSVDPVGYRTVASSRLVAQQISAALNRLDAGTYGLCTHCGGQIGPARLEALPHAAACIECQSRADAA